jgi:hypothetical protein
MTKKKCFIMSLLALWAWRRSLFGHFVRDKEKKILLHECKGQISYTGYPQQVWSGLFQIRPEPAGL